MSNIFELSEKFMLPTAIKIQRFNPKYKTVKSKAKFEYATIKEFWEPIVKFTQYYACEEFVALIANTETRG